MVLSGLGGAGKTSVAVEYAYRHLAEVRVAWQLACEDPTVLTAGFAELAAQLGARDLLDARDPVASVHGVLADYPAEWLLVFDNAPDRASVQAFLPPAGRGRVLVTSRSALWPPGQGMDVPVLDTEAAAGFLLARTGDPDQRAATDLAGELGGLPLALEQAAAYLYATAGSLAGYLAAFRQRRQHLLARGEPAGYGKTVATTWSLAFGRLEQSAPSAVEPAAAAGMLRGRSRSRCPCCCSPAPGSPKNSGATWHPRWCRCSMTHWPPATRSPRCASTHLSPRPGPDRCRCTGWCKPSPPIRCPRTWPLSGGRPPPP